MSKYAAQSASAYGLLRRKGANVPVTRKAATGYDPVSQAETSTATTHIFVGVGVPVGADSIEYDRGSLGLSSALKFSLSSASVPPFEPRPGDTVAWKGAVWTIKSATSVDPAGDGPILYSAIAVR